ncbi:MAG: mechanosensitive ion channel family protein [Bacteroidota bacterium]
MNQLEQWRQISIESLTTLGEQIMRILPGILAAILLLLVGWLLAKIFSRLVTRLFRLLHFDKLASRINELKWMQKSEYKVVPSKIIGKFVYWVILLLFIITATDTLGWSAVSQSFNQLITYLPQLFSAIIIFVVGFYLSNLIRDFIKTTLQSFEIASASALGETAFYIIMIIVAITALEQAGVKTALLTSNIILIIASFLLAFAVAFAISSRDVFKNILSSYYGKGNFHVGQYIKFNNKQGEIVKIDRMHVTIQNGKIKYIIPTARLISEEFEIIEK